MASLVLSKLANRIDLPFGDQGNEELRSLPEELSNIPFIRLGEQDIQPPTPEALLAPFLHHALPHDETT